MEHLNMKQAQSPPPQPCPLHTPSCCAESLPFAMCPPTGCDLLTPGCHGVQTGGHSRTNWGTEPSSTLIKTTPMTFPTSSMRWKQQSWPRTAAQQLWKREEHFTLSVPMTLSLGISLVPGSWVFILGHWWRQGSMERAFLWLRKLLLPSPTVFSILLTLLVWMSDFLICSLSDYSSTLFWRPVSHL